LRRHFGTVRQEPFIFSATVAENIALMNPATSREDIIVAAQQANADAFIRRLEQGYDTKLRERGAGLSAGQKQLLALARIMLQREARVLILDEATANVDSETEGWIQDALKTVMVGRTGIIIAHRLSTIRHADRILVFQHGRLLAQGRHEDLLQQGGYYRRLYEYLVMTENSG
jgi:ATP-binding cassette subfamily B protein